MTISRLGGQLIDQKLLNAFLAAGKNDGKITRPEVQNVIAGALVDHGSFSRQEKATVLFALEHLKFSAAGEKALTQLIGSLRPTQTTQNALIARGLTPPIPFSDLSDNLTAQGRTADLYAVKTVMTGKQKGDMWTNGLSLVDFNNLLKKALRPAQPQTLLREFKDWDIQNVVDGFSTKERARFDGGQMSRGEVMNLIYRQWERDEPAIKGMTPYQKGYKATYQPLI
jgi:hypothetical protein